MKATTFTPDPLSSLHPASACKRLMFRHLIRRHFYHTWVGMLLPPYSHPVTHSLRNQIVGLRHFRYRPRPLKNLRDDLFFKLFTKFRSRIVQILPHMFE